MTYPTAECPGCHLEAGVYRGRFTMHGPGPRGQLFCAGSGTAAPEVEPMGVAEACEVLGKRLPPPSSEDRKVP